jgi:mannose-6-phosphate isomerase-like protein (cupin superfamily)
MKRRNFLQLPLAAFAISMDPKILFDDRPGKGIKVDAGKDRYSEELLIMGGRFDCKISARDTAGDLCIYDTIRESKGGPALHLHHNQDEWFYVLRGEFIVRVGDEILNLKPGDSAFGPRKIPHTFAKISEGEAQVLILFQPAGNIEDFFKKMSEIGKDIPANQENVLKALWESHGMEVVGPPLKI